MFHEKVNAIIQLSEETDYEGGDFEFGITNTEGTGLITGNRTKGCLLVFPSFLSHRVTPITKGTRYSIITWMEGQYIQMKINNMSLSTMVIDNTIILRLVVYHRIRTRWSRN